MGKDLDFGDILAIFPVGKGSRQMNSPAGRDISCTFKILFSAKEAYFNLDRSFGCPCYTESSAETWRRRNIKVFLKTLRISP